jgi:hypothetical protein
MVQHSRSDRQVGGPFDRAVAREQDAIKRHESAARQQDEIAAQLEQHALDDRDDALRDESVDNAAHARERAASAREPAERGQVRAFAVVVEDGVPAYRRLRGRHSGVQGEPDRLAGAGSGVAHAPPIGEGLHDVQASPVRFVRVRAVCSHGAGCLVADFDTDRMFGRDDAEGERGLGVDDGVGDEFGDHEFEIVEAVRDNLGQCLDGV